MNKQTYVARGPEDLIALAPYLIGFHPEESVVLLTFGHPPGGFHARVDLPRADGERSEVVRILLEAVRTNKVDTVAVLVFSRDAGASHTICADLVAALRPHADVLDAIRVDGERWWSELDDSATEHRFDATAHPFTAERVYDGQAAWSSRDDLVASLRRPTGAAAVRDTAAIAEAADTVATDVLADAADPAATRVHAVWLRDRLARALADGATLSVKDASLSVEDATLSVDDTARVLVLVQVSALRDVACAGLSRSSAADHVRLWRVLLLRAPDDLVPGAAGVLALAAWLAGDGALAWCAIDRCLAVDAKHSLAHHVAATLQHAVSPATWRPVDAAELPVLHGLEQAS